LRTAFPFIISEAAMLEHLPNPFIEPDDRFVLDEESFMAAIDPLPAFLRDPSPEYRFGRASTLPQQENADV
jgi:hypothetical protein